MKTLLAMLVLAAATAPAAAGPDFVTGNPRPRPLAASAGAREIAPIDDIRFALDSYALSSVAQQQLASAAAWLKRNPRFRIVLEGYTDASGPGYYNEDLATRRAARARQYLVGLGVPSHRIIVVVYGEQAATAAIDESTRKVVMYATDRTAQQIARASLDRKRALNAVWVERDTLFRESRPVLVGTR
jgi:outer membrane protein OmpA-like peptidoglycan-associated protein